MYGFVVERVVGSTARGTRGGLSREVTGEEEHLERRHLPRPGGRRGATVGRRGRGGSRGAFYFRYSIGFCVNSGAVLSWSIRDLLWREIGVRF